MADKMLNSLNYWSCIITGRFRDFQRQYKILDVSYDIDLTPIPRGGQRQSKDSKGSMGSACSRKPVPTSRELYIGEQNSNRVLEQKPLFCSNKVRTTKYNAFSFVPKFFLEQFRKAANCFFLLVSLLQIIPGVSPTGRFTTLIPLSIILFLTALKEMFEDLRRLHQDKEVNERKVRVLTSTSEGQGRRFQWSVINWDQLVVGSIVQIKSDDNRSAMEAKASKLSPDIPADLLILATSETETASCSITTKNLDGETNLKNKFALPYTHNLLAQEILSNEIDDGNSKLSTSSSIATGIGNLLGDDGRFVVNCESPNKNMEVFKGQLQDLITGTSDTQRETSCSEEEAERSVIVGSILPLSIDNLLLRECRLENTEWVVASVVYTGPETKIALNNKPPPLKQSSLEKITNIQIYFILGMMILMALVCFSGYLIWRDIYKDETSLYIPNEDHASVTDNDVAQILLVYATFFILFNNLVPISLMFTVEMVKIVQAYFINCDPNMKYNLIGARARTSNLNDELGRIRHLFSDKTGTLTQNKMLFKKCVVAQVPYDTDTELNKEFASQNFATRHENIAKQSLHEFLLMMAACNSVTPHEKAAGGFISSSPDEHALVLGAKSLGYSLKSRGKNGSCVELPDRAEVQLREIHAVPFDSKRKRMSLIFKGTVDKNEEYYIFTKGADMTMLDKLNENSLSIFNSSVLPQTNEYSKLGLRVLVFASRKLSQEEVDALDTILGKLSDPKTSPEEKFLLDRDYEDMVGQLESKLDLVGCSAVEDKLQDGVPLCIASLRAANINVWMLTGDKLETALEIAYSCHLFSSDTDRFKVHKLDAKSGSSQESVVADMAKISEQIENDNRLLPGCEHGLIFEGSVLKALQFSPTNAEITQELFEFTRHFKSVAACRMEPLQKAELVEMTQKLAKGEITLAIGDGANDVPMIQAAHVGVGIQGEEGLQAVLASDYSIAQFRFLSRLLFIHGAFSYQRVSKTILYSFYKNITLYLINFWYQFFCGFSGQSIFDKVTLSLYNIAFTSLPLMSLGLLDRPVSEQQILNNLFLYRTSQLSLKFNAKVFWMWCMNGVAHSLLIFFVCLGTTEGETVLSDGHSTGVLPFGEVVYTAVILVVTFKLILVTNTFFTLTVVLIVLFGLVSWFNWFLISSYVSIGETYGFIQNLAPTPYFWFTVLLAVVVALYRDFAYKCLKTHFNPSLEDCVKMGKSPGLCKKFAKHELRPLHFSSIGEEEANIGREKATASTTQYTRL